jgi:hypothetical protein
LAERVNRLGGLLDRLEHRYGPADPVPSRDGWHLVVAENIGYLVGDNRRWQAMAALKKSVGSAPQDILGATVLNSSPWSSGVVRGSGSPGCVAARSWRWPEHPGWPIPASVAREWTESLCSPASGRCWHWTVGVEELAVHEGRIDPQWTPRLSRIIRLPWRPGSAALTLGKVEAHPGCRGRLRGAVDGVSQERRLGGRRSSGST